MHEHATTLPAYLPRHEVGLSKGRRLIVKREAGRWHVGLYTRVSWPSGAWGWNTGESETLSRALEGAFGVTTPSEETRQVEFYLLDAIYRDAVRCMPAA